MSVITLLRCLALCGLALRCLALALLTTGCGYGYRAALGPTWIEGDGVGATARLTGHVAPIAGGGLANPIGFGGWITRTGRDTTAGLVLTSEIALMPGGFDPPRAQPRRGLGGGALFAPLFSADGAALAGGGVLRWGRCPVVGNERWSTGGGKASLSIHWDEIECRNLALITQVGRFSPDGRLPATGPWRVDTLFAFEHLWLDD